MSFVRIGTYDGMGVWLATSFEYFIAAVEPARLPEGLSVALVCGPSDENRELELFALADAVARRKPALVHCFGTFAESLHDLVDSALIRTGQHGVTTWWTESLDPREVTFELFCTDLPAEKDFERWSGRVFVLDQNLAGSEREALTSGLQEVDATIKDFLNNDVDS